LNHNPEYDLVEQPRIEQLKGLGWAHVEGDEGVDMRRHPRKDRAEHAGGAKEEPDGRPAKRRGEG